MDSFFFMILLQVCLIAMNAIFACVEVAVISMNDNRLKALVLKKDKRALRLEKLTKEPSRFLSSTQISITLSGFLGSAFASENFSDYLVRFLQYMGVNLSWQVLESISVIVITILLSYITLVFGELIPKAIGMRKSEEIALSMSGFILFISSVFSPIVCFLMWSVNIVLKLLRIDIDEQRVQDSEEEIKMMADIGSETGTIDVIEKNLIKNIFEFDDLSADEILTHRTDIVMLDKNDDIDVWHQTIISNKYSYYPICDNNPDNIIGILNTKIYFRLQKTDKDSVIKNAVEKPYFVYDTLKADILFRNMKKNKHSIAIVLDEYGGVSGMITLHDLIEQLIGDLENEESHINKIDDYTYKVHGSILIEDLERELQIHLENEDYETLNGFIFHNLGDIPEDGTDLELKLETMSILIEKIEEHQILSAILKLKKPG